MMRATPVFSFKADIPGKGELEIDIAMFWQDTVGGEKVSGLLFGECKSYGTFDSKDFDRIHYLAEAFHGAVLVFSTFRKSLTRWELARIASLAKAGRKLRPRRPINPVLVLTGTELFHWSFPPHCWEPPIQEKFPRAYELMMLCEATQEIYLGLPSWQTEWLENEEKRRQRRQLRTRR